MHVPLLTSVQKAGCGTHLTKAGKWFAPCQQECIFSNGCQWLRRTLCLQLSSSVFPQVTSEYAVCANGTLRRWTNRVTGMVTDFRHPKEMPCSHCIEKDMVFKPAMKNALTPWLRSTTLASFLLAPVAFAQTKAPSGTPAVGDSKTQSNTSDAAPTKEQCIVSHRESQQAQNEGKLVHGRELARTCTSLACPGLLISDCARWLSDLDQRIPSVVFEVRLDGNPNRAAKVSADGNPILEWTRGEAHRMDPGEHQFKFELTDHEPISQNLLLAEGMRYRVVSVEFKSPVRPPPPAPVAAATGTPGAAPTRPKERPTPFAVYPLLGVGALGVAGFATFAFLGKSKEDKLKTSCSPDCSDSQLSAMKTNYLIGDIALGVGAASLITAGVVYLARPEKDAPTSSVGFVPLPGGGAGFASYRF